MTLPKHKLFVEQNEAYNSVISQIAIRDITLVEQIVTLVYLSEYYNDTLSESILEEGLKDFAKKLGLHVHKGKGLMDYFKQFTTGIGKLFYYLLKGDTEKVKELGKSIKKEDVVHFLMQLDQATLHLVTGPVHMLDAITGWHIGANLDALKKKAGETIQDLIKKVKDAFTTIKTHVAGALDGKRGQKVGDQVQRLEKLITQEIK